MIRGRAIHSYVRQSGFKRSSSKSVAAIARSAVRSWNELYTMICYAEADEPESARSSIITNFTTSHQNAIIASENFYVNINLHIYFSSDPIPNFGEVTQRLATILPRETMASLSIEVVQIPARQAARESVSALRVFAPEQI